MTKLLGIFAIALALPATALAQRQGGNGRRQESGQRSDNSGRASSQSARSDRGNGGRSYESRAQQGNNSHPGYRDHSGDRSIARGETRSDSRYNSGYHQDSRIDSRSDSRYNSGYHQNSRNDSRVDARNNSGWSRGNDGRPAYRVGDVYRGNDRPDRNVRTRVDIN